MGPMLKPSDGSVLYFYGWAGPPATVVVACAVSTVGSASNNNRVLAQFIRGGSGTNARRVFQIMMANAASAGLPPIEILSALQHGDSSEDVSGSVHPRTLASSGVSVLDEVITRYL